MSAETRVRNNKQKYPIPDYFPLSSAVNPKHMASKPTKYGPVPTYPYAGISN